MCLAARLAIIGRGIGPPSILSLRESAIPSCSFPELSSDRRQRPLSTRAVRSPKSCSDMGLTLTNSGLRLGMGHAFPIPDRH